MNNPKAKAEVPEQGGQCTLGVHLDLDSLRVVEVNRGRIARWFCVPYPDGLQLDSKEFPAFLKVRLAEFYSVLRRPFTWVVGPTPSLQVRFLSLPKVRPRQVPNLVYWTYRKEIPFDAAQTVFDYGLEGGDSPSSGSAKKMDATAYTVAQPEVDALVGLFTHAGIHVDGIVIPSFAMRNLFQSQSAGGHAETAMGLYVGEDSSSIMFVRGKQVVSHRLFKTGMNVMLDVLRDRYPDWSPVNAYRIVRAALEPGAPEAPPPAGLAADDSKQIREAVHAAFGRLVQQVERSMSAYMVGRTEEIKNIYVLGPMAGIGSLVQELGNKLGVNSQPLDLFRTAQFVDKSSATRGPGEAGMMSIALGAALSDRARTPNLVYTYVKRNLEASGVRAKKMLLAVGIVGVALMIGAGQMAYRANDRTRRELKTCMENIQRYPPIPDRAMVQRMSDKAVANSVQMKRMALRNLPMAALNQLALLTPEDVRLYVLVLEPEGIGSAAARHAKKTRSADAGADPAIRIHMEGLVLGELGAQESKLASYQLRLEDADLFEGTRLLRAEAGVEGSEPVLMFELDMQIAALADEAPSVLPPPEKGSIP